VDTDKWLLVILNQHYLVDLKKIDEIIENALYLNYNTLITYFFKKYLNSYNFEKNSYEYWELFKFVNGCISALIIMILFLAFLLLKFMNYMDYVRFFLIKFLIFDKPEIKKEICKKEEMKDLGKEKKEEKSTEEKILDQFPAVAEKLSNLKRRGGLGG
jgi:hypothetical protein